MRRGRIRWRICEKHSFAFLLTMGSLPAGQQEQTLLVRRLTNCPNVASVPQRGHLLHCGGVRL